MTGLAERFKKSLFLRLSMIFGFTVACFVIIISVSLRTIESNRAAGDIETIPDFFTRNVESIIDDIGTPPNLSNAIRLAEELDWTINIRNPIMRWSSDAENRLDVDRSAFIRPLTEDAEVRSVDSEDIIRVSRGGYDFYLYQRSRGDEGIDYAVLYVGLALGGLVLFLNYFMVNRLLSPVQLLRHGAERIQKGDLDFRVRTDRQDELGELTESINHMADSLQSMLEAKRQLLMAISHELRTPVTKAKLRLEFMPDSSGREELRRDIKEIELLISALLEAERLNGDHAALAAERVLFAGFVRSVAEQFGACEGGLEFDAPKEDADCVIDRLRVRLLITNLLNNAVRHGRGNPITVRTSFSDDAAVLEVIDRGEGISKAHLSRISEPFYRADSARQRNTGGTGLGLYLCRLIVEAHGGALLIESEVGKGTHVTARLPRPGPRR